MTKTLNQIFFFLHQNQNIFFSNIGNQNICPRMISSPMWKIQIKDYRMVIFASPLYMHHLRVSVNLDGFARNWDNVSEWSYMSTHEQHLK
jgi:hypothetical protein